VGDCGALLGVADATGPCAELFGAVPVEQVLNAAARITAPRNGGYLMCSPIWNDIVRVIAKVIVPERIHFLNEPPGTSRRSGTAAILAPGAGLDQPERVK
jgi:hypothetical protein